MKTRIINWLLSEQAICAALTAAILSIPIGTFIWACCCAGITLR